MIGNVSLNLLDLIFIEERVKMGVRSGKITHMMGSRNTKKLLTNSNKKKGGETNAIILSLMVPNYNSLPFVPNYQPQFVPNPSTTPTTTNSISSNLPNKPGGTYNQRKGNNLPRTLALFPITYTELFPHLTHNSLVVPILLKPVHSPYPNTYDLNASVITMRDLIDMGWLSFIENCPNIGNNSLPRHESTSINVVHGKHDHLAIEGQSLEPKVPTPFPYKDSRAIPWRYDMKVNLGDGKECQLALGRDWSNMDSQSLIRHDLGRDLSDMDSASLIRHGLG
ncbi:hypothetical protein CR513_57101, partial [Mucuna pruriens]